MSVQIKEVETEIGLVELAHPTIDELPDLVLMLRSEDLDLRRLVHTSSDAYSSQGRDMIRKVWGKLLSRIRIIFSDNLSKTIRIQSEGILSNPTFPEKNVTIKDPFNLATVENEDIDNLSNSQLQNIMVMKQNSKIVCAGRILPVEGSWEIVSLITDKPYRRKGLANLLIHQILEEYKQRPIYSFQSIDLVPYYMKVYSEGKPNIPPYEELPTALQRDLMYMNAFWGPNCIIRINS